MIKNIGIIVILILVILVYNNKLKQVRKDLELTVDDIKNIDRFLNLYLYVDYNNPYQEVLKQFNEYRRQKK